MLLNDLVQAANKRMTVVAALENIGQVVFELVVERASPTVSADWGSWTIGVCLGVGQAAPLSLAIPSAVAAGALLTLAPAETNALRLLKH